MEILALLTALAWASRIPDLSEDQLTIITNAIVTKYMNWTNCIVHIADDRLVVPLDSLTILGNLRQVENILVHSYEYKCQGYVIRTKHPKAFLRKWNEIAQSLVNRHTPQMLFLPVDEQPYVEDLFQSKETDFISDLLAIQIAANSTEKYELFTSNFHEPTQTPGRIGAIKLGTWPTPPEVNLFPDKIADLQGKVFRYATLQYPPYSQIDPLDGMEVRIVIEFCRKFNCSVTAVVDDGLWGEIYENHTGDGVVGNVYMDRADAGAGAVYMWENEYKYLEFSTPYLSSRVTCLVPKPQQLPGWQIPFMPFTIEMWIAQVISILVAASIMYVVHWAAKKYLSVRWMFTPFTKENASHLLVLFSEPAVVEDAADTIGENEFDTIEGNLLRAYGMSVLQPPSGRLMTNSPLRLFFTLFETLFLLFTTMYCGALESYLTVPTYYPPIDSPEDLYNAGIPWAAEHDAWIYSLLGATQPHLKALVDRFEAHPASDLVKLSEQGGYGFSIEIMAAGHVTHQKHLSGKMILNLHVMKEELYSTPSLTVLRKGSPYTEKINTLINKLLDYGLLLLWEGHVAVTYLSSRLQTALEISEGTSHEIHHPKELMVNHVQGAFIMLGIGLGFSFMTFLWEVYKARKVDRGLLMTPSEGT